jgi:hypothetical protein
MRSPFPGMDPYIEACKLWGDFHHNLIGDIQRTLNETLPDRYIVRAGERSYIEYVDPEEGSIAEYPFFPDGALRSSDLSREITQEPAAVAEDDPTAVMMHAVVETFHREIFLEVRELDPERRLVTCIEVLSPSNKRYGSVGWYQYERKRQAFVEGYANLIEIDLLRRGRRRSMAEAWPSSPYYLLALRKEQTPRCKVWPASFQNPLPVIKVPLLAPDLDLSLSLQPLVDAIYARARYALDIDYHQPLRPPLSPAEAAWLKDRLRERQASA